MLNDTQYERTQSVYLEKNLQMWEGINLQQEFFLFLKFMLLFLQ